MPWRQVAAATAAVLAGIGLARFAYSPLLPVVIAHGWFTPGEAAYLGAANLLGYLLGALLAQRLSLAMGLAWALRSTMLAVSVAFLACCTPVTFGWFFVWRLISGIAGGVLMILGPPAVLPSVPPSRRGLASGLVFTGVGLGIAASSTLVPVLLRISLTATWLGLALISLALTLLTWRWWPASALPRAVPRMAATGSGPSAFTAISLSYGLCAIGLVPHMVFLVDYVARGQGRGLGAGSLAWVLFGLGALSGPVLLGRLTDHVGPVATYRVGLAIEGAGLAGLLLHNPAAFGLMAFATGLLVPGLTAVMLSRVQAAAGPDAAARQRGWTQATVAWALGQAAAAYGLAWVYGRSGRYTLVLALAALAVVSAAATEVWITRFGLPRASDRRRFHGHATGPSGNPLSEGEV